MITAKSSRSVALALVLRRRPWPPPPRLGWSAACCCALIVLSGAFAAALTPAASAAAPARTNPPPITGIVRRAAAGSSSSGGPPIRGATVVATRADSPKVTRVTTDARGRFRLTRPGNQQQGHVWLTAFAPGRAAVGARAATPDGRRQDVVLNLPPETRLPVRVTDTSGRPVAGVRLNIQGYAEAVSPLLAPPTGRDGRTVVRHLPRGGRARVQVHGGPDWVGALARLIYNPEVPLADGPLSRELTLRVQPAAHLEGRLVTHNGTALAGIEISLQGTLQGGSGVTDARGRFRIDGLASGRHSVRMWLSRALAARLWGRRQVPLSVEMAQRAGHLPRDFVVPPNLTVDLAAGERRRNFTIVAPRGSLVSGRVIDTAGRPVKGVWVGAAVPQPPGAMCLVIVFGARTDSRGRFEMRLPAGKWQFHLSAPEGYDNSRDILPPGAKNPVTKTQNGRDVDLGVIRVAVLRKIPRVRGRVLNPDGSPAGVATVFWLTKNARQYRSILPYSPHTLARADGTFDLEVPGGGPVTLHARRGEQQRPPMGTTVLSGVPPG